MSTDQSRVRRASRTSWHGFAGWAIGSAMMFYSAFLLVFRMAAFNGPFAHACSAVIASVVVGAIGYRNRDGRPPR
jgi:hypothetical protein